MHATALLNNSARGDALYKPFAGGGSTIVASEKSRRRCLAMEIEPRSCDVCIERWQTATGGLAVLAEDGRTCDAVADERLTRAA